MAIRAVVFDVFGTLVALQERRHPFRKLQALLELAGRKKQPEDSACIMTHEVGIAGAAALFGVNLAMDDLAILERDLQAELEAVRLFPESVAVLNALRASGFKLGICSNLAAPYAIPVQLLLPFQLDAYAWSYRVGALKPNPAIYANVCQQLECLPSEVLTVGDTLEADFLGPQRFGLQSLLLSRDGNGEQGRSISCLTEIAAHLEIDLKGKGEPA